VTGWQQENSQPTLRLCRVVVTLDLHARIIAVVIRKTKFRAIDLASFTNARCLVASDIQSDSSKRCQRLNADRLNSEGERP
jgi:hypothetical protein